MSTMPKAARDTAMTPRTHSHFIDGADSASDGGAVIERRNPATGDIVATWPEGTPGDVDRAVAAAVAAFEDGRWSDLPASGRSDVLRAVSAVLKADGHDLALVESRETGKTLVQAAEEVAWAGDIWDLAAGQARSLHGDSHANLGDDKLALALREPVGPVALITPWNYPLIVLSMKLAFALAAGCTVVAKPSELTSGTTLMLARLLKAAGLPDGVFNVVTGYGDPVGQRLAAHPDLRLVSFTGSTATGRKVLTLAAGNMKKVVMELGGKNPTVVFEDADFEAAVDGTIKGFVYNAGAECCSGSRVFVQRPLAAAFTQKLCRSLETVRVGDPLDPATTMGAIVSETQLAKIVRYIEDGRKAGTLVFGGRRLDRPGLFVEPTVFCDVPTTAGIAREEVFGPVIVVVPFDDLAEAVALANDTEYGLAASIWTSDLATAMTMSRRVRSGIVWVNTFLDLPSEVSIGGVRQSGFGRENGRYAIEEFTVLKTIVIQNPATAGRYLA